MSTIKSSIIVENIEEKFQYPIILRCVYDSMLIVLFYEKRNGIVLSTSNQYGANGDDYIGKCLKNENMDEWEPILPGTKIVLE